jgi:hypothetical protein
VRLGPLTGSILAHVAALAILAPVAHRRAIVVPPAPAGEDEPPIDVTFIEETNHGGTEATELGERIGPEPSVASARLRFSSSRIGTETAPVDSNGSGATEAPAKRQPGSVYMHMRGPELHISDAEADQIFAHPEAPPATIAHNEKLENAPGGRGVIRDPVAVIDVDKDGYAHVNATPDIDVHFHVPLPSLHSLRYSERAIRDFENDVGKGIRDWYADPYKEMRKGPATELPDHLKAEPGQCDQYGALNCEPEPMPPPRTIASGKADLTAYLAKKFGVGDVYSTRKRKLLDGTIDERAQRGEVYRTQQLKRAPELARRNLVQLWAGTQDPVARREALFAMWDECAEGEGSLGEAGELARKEVIDWIVAYLPRSSPGAFSDDDIRRLSAHRTSKQAFDPYAGVVDSPDVGSAGSAR